MPPVLADCADEAPPVLDQPPGVGELWAGAEGEAGCEGLLLPDQPDDPELPEGLEGAGELGREELDHPEELERLPPDEKDPLDLAMDAPAGPRTRTRAIARARIERTRMWGLSLEDLEGLR